MVGTLPKEKLELIAKEKLNEDPSRLHSDLDAIKQWIKKQPHLDGHVPLDDKLLLYFLRGCKFSLERTKEKLDFFYSIKANCPEWFDNWDVEDEDRVRGMVKQGLFIRLKGYDKEGRYVFINRSGELNPETQSLSDQFRLFFIMQELIMHECGQDSITGFVGIIDMDKMGLKHATLYTPSLGMKAMVVWQDAYPTRPQVMHMVNMPPPMEAVFTLYKSFANEKMQRRMNAHPKGQGYDSLVESLGEDVLPTEYGGKNGLLQEHIDYTLKTFQDNGQWFRDVCKYKAEESKRPGKAKTYSDIFGMEGSFRKLNVD